MRAGGNEASDCDRLIAQAPVMQRFFGRAGNETGDSALGQRSPMRNNTPNPTCEACGQRTSLLRSERHPKFANMLERVFVCRCGATASDIVAETTRRPALAVKVTTAVQGA